MGVEGKSRAKQAADKDEVPASQAAGSRNPSKQLRLTTAWAPRRDASDGQGSSPRRPCSPLSRCVHRCWSTMQSCSPQALLSCPRGAASQPPPPLQETAWASADNKGQRLTSQPKHFHSAS